MKHNKLVSVLFVATVSALLNGVLAAVFAPFFSALLLFLNAPAVGSKAADTGMLVAVVAPFAWAAIGFALGALMAFGHNMFVRALLWTPTDRAVVIHDEIKVRAVRDAA